jgi:lysophospholipase L1-like esterase
MAIKVGRRSVLAVLAGSASVAALRMGSAAVTGVGGPPTFVPAGYVCEGDSHTTGWNGVLGYPTHLATMTGLGFTSVATAGDALYQIDAAYATSTAPAYNAASRDTLIVIGGDEDFIDGRTVAQAQASIQSICSKAKATGFKFVIVAPIMAVGAASWTGTMETKRQEYNTWLRANWNTFADAITDHAADERLSNPNNRTYFQADKMHLTAAGYAVMAEHAKAASNGPTP